MTALPLPPLWAYLGLSGLVWACLGLSGPIWGYLGPFGISGIRAYLDLFGAI